MHISSPARALAGYRSDEDCLWDNALASQRLKLAGHAEFKRTAEPTLHQEVRFRTLRCYPRTSAMESGASNVFEIIRKVVDARTSERQGRETDSDASGSMEKKKQEGYF